MDDRLRFDHRLVSAPDSTRGWVTFSLDGKFAYPSTGEVIDPKTKKIIVVLKDEKGREVHSEKVIEIHWKDGVPVRVGDQFGLGRAP